MKGEYNSIDDAVRKYPALKQTVKLANEFDVTLIKHYAKFTKRGSVCQHLWLAKASFEKNADWQRNQDLICWLRNCKDMFNKVMEDHKKNIGKQVCKCSITTRTLNNKPFKSGNITNTIKDVVKHPVLGNPAYTFVEDNSIVECRRCEIV